MSHPEQPMGADSSAAASQPSGGKKNLWIALGGGLVIIAGLVRVFGGLDKSSQLDAANKLVDEAKVSVAQASQHDADGTKQADLVFGEAIMAEFPANRTKFKPDADKAIEAFGKSAEQFRLASRQFQEAADMRVDPALKEYWGLKSKQMVKLADIQDIMIKQYRLALDESITDRAQLTAKIQETSAQVDDAAKQATDLHAQAEKVIADHPGVFTK